MVILNSLILSYNCLSFLFSFRPEKFSEETQNLKPEDNPRHSNATESGSDSSEDSESSNDDDLFVNTNRPQVTCEESSGDSDSDANSSESEDK